MPAKQFVLHAPYTRRIPDPVFGDSLGAIRHILFVPVRDVPRDIPDKPNARTPNINRSVYREIERHLLEEEGEPGTFHLKNRGIVMIASKVEQRAEDHYVVTVNDAEGILDGGHTYALITKDRGDEELPEDQWVKFEILTHVPLEWVPELAGGLNTSSQVKAMSLDDLAKKFDWIKAELELEPYFDRLAFKENERGDVDARDIIALLTMFNIERFPNEGDDQPVEAYSAKARTLDWFEQNEVQYQRLRPILKDILTLHDTIRFESRDHWNEQPGGKYGLLAFVEQRGTKEWHFPFIERNHKYRLTNGALYPMLASFRWMVEEGPNGVVQWRGDFDGVLGIWRQSAQELLRSVNDASTALGRNPNAVGKSKNLWSTLHALVAKREMMATRSQ